MLILPLLAKLEWVRLTVPVFYPLGAVLGGYLFGLTMAWAGGCASGVWYKAREGGGRTLIALFGLVFGATFAEEGPLGWLREPIQRVLTAEQHALTVGDLVGVDWLGYPLGALILVWLVRSPVTAPDKA